jgi:hypothetical protein
MAALGGMRRTRSAGIAAGIVLLFAGCAPHVQYAIPALTADAFRQPFVALGGNCEENQAGQDYGWGVNCMLNPTPACTGPDCPTWISSASGGGPSEVDGTYADTDLATPGALSWLQALASARYEGADPAVAQAWVAAHFSDPACQASPTATWQTVIGHAGFTLTCDNRNRHNASLWMWQKDNPLHGG